MDIMGDMGDISQLQGPGRVSGNHLRQGLVCASRCGGKNQKNSKYSTINMLELYL